MSDKASLPGPQGFSDAFDKIWSQGDTTTHQQKPGGAHQMLLEAAAEPPLIDFHTDEGKNGKATKAMKRRLRLDHFTLPQITATTTRSPGGTSSLIATPPSASAKSSKSPRPWPSPNSPASPGYSHPLPAEGKRRSARFNSAPQQQFRRMSANMHISTSSTGTGSLSCVDVDPVASVVDIVRDIDANPEAFVERCMKHFSAPQWQCHIQKLAVEVAPVKIKTISKLRQQARKEPTVPYRAEDGSHTIVTKQIFRSVIEKCRTPIPAAKVTILLQAMPVPKLELKDDRLVNPKIWSLDPHEYVDLRDYEKLMSRAPCREELVHWALVRKFGSISRAAQALDPHRNGAIDCALFSEEIKCVIGGDDMATHYFISNIRRSQLSANSQAIRVGKVGNAHNATTSVPLDQASFLKFFGDICDVCGQADWMALATKNVQERHAIAVHKATILAMKAKPTRPARRATITCTNMDDALANDPLPTINSPTASDFDTVSTLTGSYAPMMYDPPCAAEPESAPNEKFAPQNMRDSVDVPVAAMQSAPAVLGDSGVTIPPNSARPSSLFARRRQRSLTDNTRTKPRRRSSTLSSSSHSMSSDKHDGTEDDFFGSSPDSSPVRSRGPARSKEGHGSGGSGDVTPTMTMLSMMSTATDLMASSNSLPSQLSSASTTSIDIPTPPVSARRGRMWDRDDADSDSPSVIGAGTMSGHVDRGEDSPNVARRKIVSVTKQHSSRMTEASRTSGLKTTDRPNRSRPIAVGKHAQDLSVRATVASVSPLRQRAAAHRDVVTNWRQRLLSHVDNALRAFDGKGIEGKNEHDKVDENVASLLGDRQMLSPPMSKMKKAGSNTALSLRERMARLRCELNDDDDDPTKLSSSF